MSGMDQQDERTQTEEDAKEDLELKDEDADAVRGGDRYLGHDTPFEFLKIEP